MISDVIATGCGCLVMAAGHIVGWGAVGFVLYGFTHSYSAYYEHRTWIDYAVCFLICVVVYKLARWLVEHIIMIPLMLVAFIFRDRED